MKKYFLIISALLAFILCGCSEDSENLRAPETSAVPNNYTAQASDTYVSGEVLSITGNEVTLALGTLSESDSSESDSGAEQNMPQGEMPERKMPEGELPNERAEQSGRGKPRKTLTEKSGETASYIIPVGMTVDGLSGKNSDYSGISEGMTLTLTINSDGVVCAAAVE